MLTPEAKQKAYEALPTIAQNLLAPLDEGGCALRDGDDLYFCELCRTDGHVIVNGWVFALFGLRDYAEFSADDDIRAALEHSARTLANRIDDYLLPCDWSMYDNRGRTASPFYHALHVSLIDAMHRLMSPGVTASRKTGTGSTPSGACAPDPPAARRACPLFSTDQPSAAIDVRDKLAAALARLRRGNTAANRGYFLAKKAVAKLAEKSRYTTSQPAAGENQRRAA